METPEATRTASPAPALVLAVLFIATPTRAAAVHGRGGAGRRRLDSAGGSMTARISYRTHGAPGRPGSVRRCPRQRPSGSSSIPAGSGLY